MVTGAVWAEIDGDNKKELIIVGQWMAPLVFKYSNNSFNPLKTNLENMSGWWQTVAATDINGDGKTDLVLGNIGENFFLNPSAQAPVKLFLNDFDGNGQVDKIVTRTIDGKDKPVFMKGEMESQLPMLKKQNLHHKAYAVKSVQELFDKTKIESSIVKTVNYTSSCIALNKGNGNFSIHNFPAMVQLSSVKAIVAKDINNDGKTDLILGGNEFGFQPQLGRLDANTGEVLLNDGKGRWKVLSEYKSGISVNAQVRDMAVVNRHSNTNILFLLNNELPVLYELKNKLKK
jgi:hypothetical protein